MHQIAHNMQKTVNNMQKTVNNMKETVNNMHSRSVCRSTHPSTRPSVRLSVCMSVCRSVGQLNRIFRQKYAIYTSQIKIKLIHYNSHNIDPQVHVIFYTDINYGLGVLGQMFGVNHQHNTIMLDIAIKSCTYTSVDVFDVGL